MAQVYKKQFRNQDVLFRRFWGQGTPFFRKKKIAEINVLPLSIVERVWSCMVSTLSGRLVVRVPAYSY